MEGPQNRSDDPADRYFDRFTAGLTAEENARMATIDRLFRDMTAFANCGPVPGPGNLTAIGQAASAARPALNVDLPIAYRAELWVADGAGRWRKRRDASAAG